MENELRAIRIYTNNKKYIDIQCNERTVKKDILELWNKKKWYVRKALQVYYRRIRNEIPYQKYIKVREYTILRHTEIKFKIKRTNIDNCKLLYNNAEVNLSDYLAASKMFNTYKESQASITYDLMTFPNAKVYLEEPVVEPKIYIIRVNFNDGLDLSYNNLFGDYIWKTH